MLGYDPIAYHVFISVAFVMFLLAAVATGRAWVARQDTVGRLKHTLAAVVAWAGCALFLFAPLFGAAHWLADRL